MEGSTEVLDAGSVCLIAPLTAINARSLRRVVHREGRLELEYQREAADELAHVIAREQLRLPFLRFAVLDHGNSVLVIIRMPPHLEDFPEPLLTAYTRIT